ncbi:MAG: hypothetical protein A2Y08_04035 [Planctomycetes bacterium GWA2_40_7]|nr:MAG: hypothetical protein A2Y08_04035 [Planctomycetes bacterium GWA2_40_7]
MRPKPGFEDYDRVLAVTGAFSDGRRIETDMVFRSFKRKASDGPGFPKNLLNLTNDVPYGFGILPMWGGRPDSQGITPRRGWNFCIAWFYSRYKGVGMEFSYKQGDLSPKWISTYRNFNVEENRKYFLNVECWPEREETGRHVLYRQRMKWWAEGESEPDNWMELDDIAGSTLPDGEYAVALVAHRSQVDFGPVTVKPIKQ